MPAPFRQNVLPSCSTCSIESSSFVLVLLVRCVVFILGQDVADGPNNLCALSYLSFARDACVQLKEQLSQSHDKDSDLPTPLMFAAASSSLDSRSLNPLLEELLGCMCDIDEARRQR